MKAHSTRIIEISRLLQDPNHRSNENSLVFDIARVSIDGKYIGDLSRPIKIDDPLRDPTQELYLLSD